MYIFVCIRVCIRFYYIKTRIYSVCTEPRQNIPERFPRSQWSRTRPNETREDYSAKYRKHNSLYETV